jgi:hypothetical protein
MENENIFSGKGKGGGKDSAYCTVRGTTDKPTYPWCPEGFGDDYFYCRDVAKGEGPQDSDMQTYRIDFALEISGDVVSTLELIEEFLQNHIAPALAGCDGATRTHSTIDNVIFDVVEDNESSTSRVLFRIGIAVSVLTQRIIYFLPISSRAVL